MNGETGTVNPAVRRLVHVGSRYRAYLANDPFNAILLILPLATSVR